MTLAPSSILQNAILCSGALILMTALVVRAQSRDIEAELNHRFEKKVVTLRIPAAGEKLAYDSAGQMRTGKPGVGGLDDEIAIDKVAIRSRQIEFDGQRAAVMVDPKTGDARMGLALKVKLTCELPTANPGAEEVDAAVRRIFDTEQERQARACPADEAVRFKEYIQSPLRSQKRLAAEIACMADGARGYLIGGSDMQIPKGTFTPDPEFTAAMRREKRTEAHVTFAIRIDEKGRITDVIPVISPDMSVAFDAGGILRTWKFQPAKLKGNAVPVIVKVEMNMRAH